MMGDRDETAKEPDITGNDAQILSLDQKGCTGWSFFTDHPAYSPLIGAYLDGTLIGADIADRSRPSGEIEGPETHWFSLSWGDRWKLDGAAIERLRFFRCEDYCPIHVTGSERPRSKGILTVEELLENSMTLGVVAQKWHFVTEALPAHAAVDMLYLDYIGRAADWRGFDDNVRKLRDYSVSFNDLRRELLTSEEFKKRVIKLSDRLGQLSIFPFGDIYERYALLPKFLAKTVELRWDDFKSLGFEAFLALAHRRILGEMMLAHEADWQRRAIARGEVTRLSILEELMRRSSGMGRAVRLIGIPSLKSADSARYFDFLLENLQDLDDQHFILLAYRSLFHKEPVDWLRKRLAEELQSERADRRAVLELAAALPPQVFASPAA